jgi:acetylornithine/N-succinyldiaminopimelate aminotransferase
MLDEIQTGMARSGKMFAFQHEGITPDVMTLAKALGNGVPIGACLAHGKASGVFQPGNHGSTFGGNPFACEVGYTVLQTMMQQNIAENARLRGEQLISYLKEKLADQTAIKETRNLGLLVGITLDRDCGELAKVALDNQLLINITDENVIRMLPPLIINEAQITELADRLILSISQFISQ